MPEGTLGAVRAPAVVMLSLVAAACAAPAPERAPATPEGPPTVRVERARSHAAQLDELGSRPAGSQQEQAASVYLTAHLQQAGYVVFLDGVPVADLVRSTNVVARPPSGENPDVVVVAPYDTPPDRRGSGAAAGLLLELARSLAVAAPGHSVEFVALAAERTAQGGGRLGSRRLAQALLDDEGAPHVVVLGEVEDDRDCLLPAGDSTPIEAFTPESVSVCDGELDSASRDTLEVFTAAGFTAAAVGGGLEPVAGAVLDFLVSQSR